MAFEFEDPNEEDEELPGGTPIPGTEGGVIQGQQGQGSAAGPTAASANDFRSPQSAGFSGFTDIGAYLDANRPQAAALSEKVAGKLREEEQGIRSDVDTEKSSAEGAVESARIRPDEGLVTRATSDPSEFVKNQGDVSALTRMRDAVYEGPAGISDESIATLRNRISEGQRRARGVDTEAGREELLRSMGNNVTKGMLTLDNLLLGADPNSRQTLATAASPFEGLTSYLDEASGGVKSAADAARADATAARNLVSSKFTGPEGAIPTFEKNLTERLGARQAEEAAQIERIRRNLGGMYVQPQDAAELGVDAATLQALMPYSNTLQNQYGIDPDRYSYLTTRSPEEAITRANFASPEEYADYAALTQLAGTDPTFLHGEDVSQAGTAPQDLVDFDFTGLRNNVRNTLSAKDQELLTMDPASLDDATRQKWLAVAKRAGLSSWAPGNLQWNEGGGFGEIVQPLPGQPEPYIQPTPPPDAPPSPGPDYVWDPNSGSWQYMGGWTGGGGNIFSRPFWTV